MSASIKRTDSSAACSGSDPPKDVVHAPRYGRVDVAAGIEAFSHEADVLESDWGPL